jgi:hypothetical protein
MNANKQKTVWEINNSIFSISNWKNSREPNWDTYAITFFTCKVGNGNQESDCPANEAINDCFLCCKKLLVDAVVAYVNVSEKESIGIE